MAGKPKFTRIPKVNTLIQSGVPTEVIPTYCALADHANNKTGLCWPKMESLAKILNRSVRTVQRHLHLLQAHGLIEFVQRRRYKGRFSSYLYKVLHIQTTGHGSRVKKGLSNKRRTKPPMNTPQTPQNNVQDGYWWLFGQDAPPGEQKAHDQEEKHKRKEQAKRRREGFEWFFG